LDIQNNITEVLERLANFANTLQKKIRWFVLFGLIVSVYLAWQAYSIDSALWWNIAKCSLVMLPSLLWAFVWSVLGQLDEAPSLAAGLTAKNDGVFASLQNPDLTAKTGLKGALATLKAFREEDGLWITLDTIGNVSLLANPLFVALTFIMGGILMLFFVIALMILVL